MKAENRKRYILGRRFGINDKPMPVRKVQVACDDCTQGVMDGQNPHLRGECPCKCHRTKQ